MALENYQKALQLNPTNNNIQTQIELIQKAMAKS
ncbi:hypothetical protein [Flexibacter flexilis]